MEWRESNRSGRPLSMGDTLQLTGAGSAMSLRSSAPALLHALRTRYPGGAAPNLNQARATYPGGVSELDAALHLLHPPDEDLEMGEITVFVEGADAASARLPLAPPCSSSSSLPAGTRGGSWGAPPPTSTGQHPYPAPPSGRPRRGTEYTPSCENRRSPPLRGST